MKTRLPIAGQCLSQHLRPAREVMQRILAFLSPVLLLAVSGAFISQPSHAAGDNGNPLGPPVRGTFWTSFEYPGAIRTGAGGMYGRTITGRWDETTILYHGFLLRNGEFRTIDFPGALRTATGGINRNGDMVGNYQNPSEFKSGTSALDTPGSGIYHGYLLRRNGAFRTIDFPGADYTITTSINNSGVIVGRYDIIIDGCTPGVTCQPHGFILEGGEWFRTIDVPDASETVCFNINAGGDIVGRYVQNGQHHGFLLTKEGFTSIDFPGASLTWAFGINRHRDIVGRYLMPGSSTSHGFLLHRGQFTSLDFPGALSTFDAHAINNRGDICGIYTAADNKDRAWCVSDRLLGDGDSDDDAQGSDDGDLDGTAQQ